MSSVFLSSRILSSKFISHTSDKFNRSLFRNKFFPNIFQNIGRMSSSFEKACENAKSLKKEPGNDVKLNMYALFKQATEGECKKSKPSVFDMVGKAKWDAWNSLGSMSKEDAEKKYISLVEELINASEESGKNSNYDSTKYEGLTFSVIDDITVIKFNRPEKKNAINTEMYKAMTSALKEASENETAITILTGEGDYFSSGNDLSNFTKVPDDVSEFAKQSAQMLNKFVEAFIDFPKILVAVVNGPAVGIPVTLLGLCDVVYASDKATFQTPFSLLGQSPEACSTYTFPKIMGYAKANEILIFNKKFTAEEGKAIGLITEVFPHETFAAEVKNRLAFLPNASKQSMLYSKELIRKQDKEILHNVNDEECERLVERWQSQDCMEALIRFFQRKAKI